MLEDKYLMICVYIYTYLCLDGVCDYVYAQVCMLIVSWFNIDRIYC